MLNKFFIYWELIDYELACESKLTNVKYAVKTTTS